MEDEWEEEVIRLRLLNSNISLTWLALACVFTVGVSIKIVKPTGIRSSNSVRCLNHFPTRTL